ncbi:MAG: hypothetical protein GX651_07440 [Methanomicrobiales archaeon]|nr:hypothetical protein [Methanomicrobiales archaeon]
MASNVKTLVAALFGILYLVFGVTELISALISDIADLTSPFMIPADLIGGLVLCIVGAIYLSALHRFTTGSGNGPAYLYVAMALSVIFGAVSLLSLAAQGIDLILFGDEQWSPVTLLVPMMYLAIVPALGISRWGQRFTGNLSGDA